MCKSLDVSFLLALSLTQCLSLLHAHTHTHAHTHRAHTSIGRHLRRHIRRYTHVYVNKHPHACTCKHIQTHAHAHIYVTVWAKTSLVHTSDFVWLMTCNNFVECHTKLKFSAIITWCLMYWHCKFQLSGPLPAKVIKHQSGKFGSVN